MDGYIRVEYDENYSGGNYSGEGKYAFIPLTAMKSVGRLTDKGVANAFTEATGIDSVHIIHYSNQLYTKDGKPI